MVEMREVLQERNTTYNQTQSTRLGTNTDAMLVALQRPTLNGDMGFYGGKNRSSSICSFDEGSQLECLLEEADQIGTRKNGLTKDVPHKKQVRFDMGRNEQFHYSYTGSSDDDSGKFDMEHHINYVNYQHSNGYGDYGDNDDDNGDNVDDDDDDEEEEENYEEDEDEETDTENTDDDVMHGYLVNKCAGYERDIDSVVTNGTVEHSNGLPEGVDDVDSQRESCLREGNNEQEIGEVVDDKNAGDIKSQAGQLESVLIARQLSVKNKMMSDLGEQLRNAREVTKQEIDKLQQELENRRQEYMTEMVEFNRNREEQKRKFEEELQEFRNEKKLVERRERYREHEALISKQEEELVQRKEQALDQEKEILEHEEYLNRRHNVCNSKEEDLNILQGELECLAQELEARKEHLEKKLNEHGEDEDLVAIPPSYARQRSASRVSCIGRGVELRVEELKLQNRQLLDELFTLRKACDSKDEDLADLRSKLDVSENENRRLQQKVKHLDTHLGLARKTAELGTESLSPSVEAIMHRTSVDIRNTRGSRLDPRLSRVSVPCGSSSVSSQARPPWLPSEDSVVTKASTSSESSKSTKETNTRGFKSSKNGKDARDGRDKLGRERTISSMCAVM